MRKFAALTLFILFSFRSLGEDKTIKGNVISVYCVGAALCEMARQIVKEEEGVSFKYTEFPVIIDKKKVKGLPYPDIFLTYPIELTSGWSDYIYKVFWKKPNSTFTVGREASLKIFYPRKKSHILMPVVDEVDDAVYFPFYFYPKAINFVYESLYGFLSKVAPVKESAMNGVFLKEKITYDLEDCLQKISVKHKIEFIFPTERLAVFFSHIGIKNSVIGNLNERNLTKEDFKNSKHLIFFNLTENEKSIAKSLPILAGKNISFWDIPYEREQFSVNPGIFLNKVFSSAVKITGFSNECKASFE